MTDGDANDATDTAAGTAASAFTRTPLPAPRSPPAPPSLHLPQRGVPTPVSPSQLASSQAYRRFARDAQQPAVEVFYTDASEEPAARTRLADDLVPSGKSRRRPAGRGGSRRLRTAALGLVLGAGGAAAAYALSSPTSGGTVAGPAPLVVDATLATSARTFTVPRQSTSGPFYVVPVPPGWRATSTPTHPGGSHTDVLLEEPALHLTMTVHSEPRTAPSRLPAGSASTTTLLGAHAEVRDSTTGGRHRRTVVATRGAVRYRVEVDGPAVSQRQDLARVAPLLAGIGAS